LSEPTCRPALPRLEPTEVGLICRAPAKINLDLLVGPLRDDGYHPLDSLVARVSLYDELTLTPRTDGRIILACSGVGCGPIEENLALRAARLIAADRNVSGVEIALQKVIPPGAGLGGGSSDAAAVLVGCDALWDLGLDRGELARLAGQLGSDVPLFLGPPACRMRGRGEHVEPAKVHPMKVLLIVPPAHCSTAAVYRAFDEHSSGPLADRPVDERYRRPPSQWRDGLVNDLAGAARRVSGALADWWDRLANQLPVRVQLTGSGSGLFCLCDDEAELVVCRDALDAEARSRSWAVVTIGDDAALGR
jgi:4-diphosphocytidyl-2-C-methyl-D-erythritol kinase